MSFIVAINGQFSPYIYKIPASSGRIASLDPIKKVRDFDEVLETIEEAPSQAHGGLKSYQKQEKNYQRQKKKVFARDIMSSPVLTLGHDQSVHEAAQLMSQRGFRHIVIIKKETILGTIYSEKMLNQPSHQKLEDVIEQKIILGLESARLNDVAHLMLDEKLNALPIVDSHQKLVGIITLSDILKFVVHLPELSF